MSFDGSFSKIGKGVSIVLTSPSKKKFNFAYRLEFDASNNVTDYEALVLELLKTSISNLIISQVKETCACKSERLKKFEIQFGPS